VERLLDATERRDAELGRGRPEVINALLADVHAKLDAARRLQLARDQWKERVRSFRAYQKAVGPVLSTLEAAQRRLDDIKRLAGSEAGTLLSLSAHIADGSRRLAVIAAPDELKTAHAMLVSALNLAENAIRNRRQAVVSGELSSAWDASSAAAGSMMLFTRAREEMEATVKFPQIR
jgi:hypothetical protein